MGTGLYLFARQFLADDRRFAGFDRHGDDGLALGLLDVAGDPCDGAAGADACHKHIHLAVGGIPDLGASGLLVDLGVGGVFELLQQHILARLGFEDLVGLGNGALHAQRAFGQHQVGAKRLEQLAALQAHGGRHGQGDGIATGRSHERQGNARVTAGRLDDLLALGQHAAFLGIPDEIGADPALDAEARVAALDLGQHAALGNTVETNQRGVAYGLAVVLKNFAHGAIPVFVKAMKQDYPVVSE